MSPTNHNSGAPADQSFHTLKLLQINLNHTPSASDLLLNFALDNNIDIICLQDPYLKNFKIPNLPPDFKVFSSTSGGSLIIICNNLITSHILCSTNSGIFLNLCFNNSSFTIASVYLRPNDDITVQLAEFNNIDLIHRNIFLSGDFNGRAEEWGYRAPDTRGNLIKEFILQNNLTLFNVPGLGPSFVTYNRTGNPDLTLGSPSISNLLNNWKILDIETLSDHKYIYFELSTLCPNQTVNDFYFKTAYPISKFIRKLKTYLPDLLDQINNISNTDDLESFTEYFISLISSLAFKNIKKKKKPNNFKFKWFTKELATSRNRVTALYKNF